MASVPSSSLTSDSQNSATHPIQPKREVSASQNSATHPIQPKHEVSDSHNSATHHIQPKCEVDDVATDNGVFDVSEKKPDAVPSHFQILENKEYIEKFQKYEADYTRRLLSKYFSKNDVHGGNIFDEKTAIDGETIMSSRWPCTRSFADPLQVLEDQSSSTSSSTAETPNNFSNGNQAPKKSG